MQVFAVLSAWMDRASGLLLIKVSEFITNLLIYFFACGQPENMADNPYEIIFVDSRRCPLDNHTFFDFESLFRTLHDYSSPLSSCDSVIFQWRSQKREEFHRHRWDLQRKLPSPAQLHFRIRECSTRRFTFGKQKIQKSAALQYSV